MRQRAHEAAKTLTVRVPSAVVLRLLELTDTVDLLTGLDAAHLSRKGGTENFQTENDQLRRAMQTRPAIDIARGILMASYTLSAEQAWNVLVSASQHSNTKLHLIAETLMNTVQGENLPEPLASHLSQALQEQGNLPH